MIMVNHKFIHIFSLYTTNKIHLLFRNSSTTSQASTNGGLHQTEAAHVRRKDGRSLQVDRQAA